MSGGIGVKRGLKRSLGALIVQVLVEETSDEADMRGWDEIDGGIGDLCCLKIGGEALMFMHMIKRGNSGLNRVTFLQNFQPSFEANNFRSSTAVTCLSN